MRKKGLDTGNAAINMRNHAWIGIEGKKACTKARCIRCGLIKEQKWNPDKKQSYLQFTNNRNETSLLNSPCTQPNSYE